MLWSTPLIVGAITREGLGDDSTAESIGVLVLSLANIAGVIIAFRREQLGGRVLLVTGTAFAVFGFVTAGRNEVLAAAGSGGVFVISGVLFLAANQAERWRRRREQ